MLLELYGSMSRTLSYLMPVTIFFFYNNEKHINQKETKKNIQQRPDNFMCAEGKSGL